MFLSEQEERKQMSTGKADPLESRATSELDRGMSRAVLKMG
jgi:hypothetical protein